LDEDNVLNLFLCDDRLLANAGCLKALLAPSEPLNRENPDPEICGVIVKVDHGSFVLNR
jgi:hypothetical protein